jgi:AdoMet-dependent rRNA methyltransferase SPB1
VAAEVMPVNSLIVGVDLSPIKPIPRVITFQSDITTDKCRATIRQHLKTWKADTVLHDGAPNVGTAWVQDSFNQAELALQSLKLATEFLVEGGTFVSKVFRSKDYNSLLWVCNQLFTKVEATKPPSSRNVSAEIFVVCRGFKAPKRIDPRLLDPQSVFAELQGATPNNEAKVFNPEVKKRKRDGYDEGDYILYKETTASEFIQTTDPISVLGTYNKLTFKQPPNGDVALAALDKLPETTSEVRTCCDDLKVLGRRDFKLLLKWRLKVRDIFGFASKEKEETADPEEVANVESMDEELREQEELQAMKDREDTKKKRERRKENEKKQREIVRMQLNMVAPMDIGMEEAGPIGEGSMFSLKKADQSDVMRRLAKGKMAISSEVKQKDKDSGLGSSIDAEDDSDDDGDELEGELDSMYEQYKERKSELDAKYRAKKARQEHDDEWEGLSAEEQSPAEDSSDLEEEEDDSEEDEDDKLPTRGLLRDLEESAAGDGGLSKRATAFFSQDIFQGVADMVPKSVNDGSVGHAKDTKRQDKHDQPSTAVSHLSATNSDMLEADNTDEEDQFEVVRRGAPEAGDDDGWEEVEKKRSDGKPGMF